MQRASENIKEFPWKNGMWYNPGQTCMLYCVNGETADCKNIMVLDYAKTTAMFSGKWISGDDFGDVPEEHVEKVGGVKKYNLMMDYNLFKIPGVLHENGIKIYAKSLMPGNVRQVYLKKVQTNFFLFVEKKMFFIRKS